MLSVNLVSDNLLNKTNFRFMSVSLFARLEDFNCLSFFIFTLQGFANLKCENLFIYPGFSESFIDPFKLSQAHSELQDLFLINSQSNRSSSMLRLIQVISYQSISQLFPSMLAPVHAHTVLLHIQAWAP